ncbi:putative acetyltransferase [Tenacibaculum sp. 190524A02b]
MAVNKIQRAFIYEIMENDIKLKRTTATDKKFKELAVELDAYLSKINGENDAFFKQHNQLNDLKNVVICYLDKVPVGCGAFKVITEETVEVKRMYVKDNYRGYNIGTRILKELEKWAKEAEFDNIILETSKTMLPAVNLYRKNEYSIIPNYEPYKDVTSSICFKKKIGWRILS